MAELDSSLKERLRSEERIMRAASAVFRGSRYPTSAPFALALLFERESTERKGARGLDAVRERMFG